MVPILFFFGCCLLWVEQSSTVSFLRSSSSTIAVYCFTESSPLPLVCFLLGYLAFGLITHILYLHIPFRSWGAVVLLIMLKSNRKTCNAAVYHNQTLQGAHTSSQIIQFRYRTYSHFHKMFPPEWLKDGDASCTENEMSQALQLLIDVAISLPSLKTTRVSSYRHINSRRHY